MKPRSVDNPVSRFHDQVVSYDEGEGPPPAQVTLLDDHSRSILSENTSPDLGFRWSANPYRGCLHACAYCLAGDTQILLASGRTKRLADIVVGDEILGTHNKRYVRTRVLDHWKTLKVAQRIELSDGTELVASGDHRFLTNRGWTHVNDLTKSSRFVGTGAFASAPRESSEYRRGYLTGIIRGDDRTEIDIEALSRARRYLEAEDVGDVPERMRRLVMCPPPRARTDEWRLGLLAGSFDAIGTRTRDGLRLPNGDRAILASIAEALARFDFAYAHELTRDRTPMIRVRAGLRDQLRFFHATNAAITAKWSLDGRPIETDVPMRVVARETIGLRQLFDITTGTGDFIANGVVSHNCYARPTHEYLDLGAGTDFDTKIVVKKQAPELLRAAFDKPSWQGELVMFSGVTDCYQAIEKDLQITRRCLEVCLEYKNPVAIISKSALVERDLDLFAALHRDARIFVSVSLAWTDAELARQIEPWAPSPERRLKVIETLARAGIPVNVMLAPIIPGMNDSQIVKLLERAAAAGARSAGWVLLRLPGATAQVFPERIRAAMPASADKILHRIRETRGGDKLYDARFHTRGRGEGVYADTIAQLFETTCKRLGLDAREYPDGPTTFQRPPKPGSQLALF